MPHIASMAKKQVVLRESWPLQCGDVDPDKPVVPHVKILGWESRNRRCYLPESVEVKDYEGIKVNLNHPDGLNKQRVVQERFGWFEGVVKEADGLYGNFHYNPELPYAKPFAWFAKHKPDMIGMSHDAVGVGVTRGNVFVVEKAHPKFVDLVANSASTKGLWESMENAKTPAEGEQGELNDVETHIKNSVAAICGDDSLDLKAKIKKIKAALKILEEPEEDEEDEEEDEEPKEGQEEQDGEKDRKTKESLQLLAKKQPGVKKLLERLDNVETELAIRKKTDLAHRLCQEAKLPAVAVTATFMALLLEAKDEPAMKTLIEDRGQIVGIQRPKSTGPLGRGKDGQIDNKEFAKVIREGR